MLLLLLYYDWEIYATILKKNFVSFLIDVAYSMIELFI